MKIYISKADAFLEVDFDAMPENAKAFIIEYGLKQKLNDKGASATVKDLGPVEAGKQAFAMAETSLEALMAGRISVRTAAQTISAEDRISLRVTRSLYKQFIGAKPEDDVSRETLVEVIAKKTEKEVSTIENAITKRVKAELEIEAAKKAIPTIEI